MSATLVVVLHDSAPELARLLGSLQRHGPAGAQLVVVDTDSGDDGAAIARAAGAEVVELGANPGFGAANNAGLERARHPVTVLLNPDVVLRDGALGVLAARAAAHDALHVPRLRHEDGAVQDSAHPLPGSPAELLGILPRGLLPVGARRRVEPWRADEGPIAVGWAIAACLAARTATLRTLGPFDPAAFLFYEDLELCLRARATGRPTLLHPDLELVHTGGHSTRPALGAAHERQAARRRAVVRGALGARAGRRDEAIQAATFALRAPGRGAGARRARAQLAALRRAQKSGS